MSFVVVITGPTASGKTAFAIECAKRYNGEIVSCDSMQIYRGLDIGTAKPTLEEQNQVKHHLIDIVDADRDFSVSEYVERATKVIDDILSRGKLPIITGGTGLYINALLHEYSFGKAIKNAKIREKYENILQNYGKEYLHDLLEKVDEKSAKSIHVNDTKRVIRALEIYEAHGIAKSQLNIEEKLRYDNLLFIFDIDRTILYDRINKRADEMFENGLVEEFISITEHAPQSRSWQSMQAIGYKELFSYIDGTMTLQEVKEEVKKNTRHYAKRQGTFFRGFKNAINIDILNEKNKAFTLIENALNNQL